MLHELNKESPSLAAEIENYVKEGWRMVETYGWKAMTVNPLGTGRGILVTHLLSDIGHYYEYGPIGRSELIEVAGTLARVLNAREAHVLGEAAYTAGKDEEK